MPSGRQERRASVGAVGNGERERGRDWLESGQREAGQGSRRGDGPREYQTRSRQGDAQRCQTQREIDSRKLPVASTAISARNS